MRPRRQVAIIALVLPSFMYGLYRFSVGVLVPGLETVYSVSDLTAGLVVSASVGLVGLGVLGSGYRCGPGAHTPISGSRGGVEAGRREP